MSAVNVLRRVSQAMAITALLAVTVTICLQARAPRKRPTQNNGGVFSYYMLVLSYAPDFCTEPGGNKDPRECAAGRKIGFVVHGLWPQSDSGRGPENCGSASPVSPDIIKATVSYIPTDSLIQHEWKAHGTCSGLDADAYFSSLRKARDSVTIPDELNSPGGQVQFSQSDIQSKMAAANTSFNPNSFRVSCYGDSNLQEIRVCLNKDLSSRACTASAGHCSATNVTLRAVR